MNVLVTIGLFFLIAVPFVQASDWDFGTIDDLGVVNLMINESTAGAVVNYPGMFGDGTYNVDCLILDVKFANGVRTRRAPSLQEKLSLAKRLTITDFDVKLKAEVKDQKVVYRLKSDSTYITVLKAATNSGRSLREEALTLNSSKVRLAGVKLIYVRSCRF